MTVYVDNVRHRYGRMIMCHMWADTETELHEMARAIGVARRWHQKPPKASWSHYDVSLTMKARAIHLGATLTDEFGPLEYLSKLNGNEKMLTTIAQNRERRAKVKPTKLQKGLFDE